MTKKHTLKKNSHLSFKGNKSYLPSKPCAGCQKEMTWRAAWAKNWANILYCSDACRKYKNQKITK